MSLRLAFNENSDNENTDIEIILDVKAWIHQNDFTHSTDTPTLPTKIAP